MTKGALFTPRDAVTNQRHTLRLSPEDEAKTRGRGVGSWRAIVTDLETGKSYACQAAPCSIPTCYCDGVAIEIGSLPEFSKLERQLIADAISNSDMDGETRIRLLDRWQGQEDD